MLLLHGTEVLSAIQNLCLLIYMCTIMLVCAHVQLIRATTNTSRLLFVFSYAIGQLQQRFCFMRALLVLDTKFTATVTVFARKIFVHWHHILPFQGAHVNSMHPQNAQVDISISTSQYDNNRVKEIRNGVNPSHTVHKKAHSENSSLLSFCGALWWCYAIMLCKSKKQSKEQFFYSRSSYCGLCCFHISIRLPF